MGHPYELSGSRVKEASVCGLGIIVCFVFVHFFGLSLANLMIFHVMHTINRPETNNSVLKDMLVG